MTLLDALRIVSRELAGANAAFALVGGLAVSVRTEPRFTRDADFAVAVSDDVQAEAVVRTLLGAGFGLMASNRKRSSASQRPG